MSPQQLELALKKQRLQIRSAALRDELAADAAALAPLFAAGDKIRDGARWLRGHPEAALAATVAVIVARPRVAWRWARRGFVAWRAWRRVRDWGDAGRRAA